MRGATLVEVIVFILLVGIASASVLGVFAGTSRRSADPLIEKQAMAIAESLLEEARLMPFTICDPNDANVSTAVNAAGCATTPEAMGPEAGETRYSIATPFDNVNDYNGFAMPGPGCAAGICDLSGTPVPMLAAYSAAVAVAPVAMAGIPNTDALQVTVTVTGPGGITVRLDGIRTRHAPRL